MTQRLFRHAGVVALVLALSACVADDESDAAERVDGGEPARDASPEPRSARPIPTDVRTDMQIRISIGELRVTATLDDSAAAEDLLALLPVTVAMEDHGGVEKTGPLPSPLSLDGQPDGADPDVGDLGYYAPGNDLVLYYGDQSYYPGIVVLGRLDGDAARAASRPAGRRPSPRPSRHGVTSRWSCRTSSTTWTAAP